MPDELIVLEDEDGNEFEMLFLDSFELGGHTYAVLMETDAEEQEGECVIMRVELDEHGNEAFAPIEDDTERDAVVATWAGMADDEDGEPE